MVRKSAIFLTLAVGALAQEPAPLKLTLHDAVSLALKQNPQVILATLNTEQAQQDRSIARSGLLPQVNGRVQETVNRVNLESAIGFRFPGFAQHVGPFWVSQAGVGFNAPIFDLTLWRRYKASQYGIDAARAGEINAREESVLLVVSQYLGSQRAAADVKAAQSRVDLAQALYNQAADLQRNGVGTGIDTLRSNVALQNEKQRLIVSRTELETSLFGLSRLLNLDPRQKVELADPVSFFETPAVSEDQSLENAWKSRPGAASDPQRRAARRTRPARRRRPAPPEADSERLLGRAGADTRTPPSRSTSISGESTCRCSPAGASRPSARESGDLDPPIEAAGAGYPQPHRARSEDRGGAGGERAQRGGRGQPRSAAGAAAGGAVARPLPGRRRQQCRSDSGAGRAGARQR